MSASERLKKLEEMRTATEPMTYNKPLTAGILAAKVLPEIIALVEAAENHNALRGDLDRALAALDEALDFVRLY